MESLNTKGYFEHTKAELEVLQKYFSATYSDDAYGLKTIKEYVDSGYLMDPHTATCIKGYEELAVNKELKTVIYSTAEWTKFSPTVLNALNGDDKKYSDKEALGEISSKLDLSIPEVIESLFEAKILHNTIINIEELESEIVEFLKG
jgi:threonine synthase